MNEKFPIECYVFYFYVYNSSYSFSNMYCMSKLLPMMGLTTVLPSILLLTFDV